MPIFTTVRPFSLTLILEITAGAVQFEIIPTSQSDAIPNSVWFHSEPVIVKSTKVTIDTEKQIVAALMRAVLEMTNVAIPALRKTYGAINITNCRVTYGAPWTYTLTQSHTIVSDVEEKFTRKRYTELLSTLHTKLRDLAAQDSAVHEIYTPIASYPHGLTVNDYPLLELRNEVSGKTVHLKETMFFVDTTLHAHVLQLANKVFGEQNTTISTQTLILDSYLYIQENIASIEDYLIVIVHPESTQIGIVRAGTIEQVLFTPVGLASVSRTIAEAQGIAFEHVYGLLQSSHSSIRNDKDSSLCKNAYLTYTKEIAKSLATITTNYLPNHTYLLTQSETPMDFVEGLEKELSNYTGSSNASIATITTLPYKTISAKFFHTSTHQHTVLRQ